MEAFNVNLCLVNEAVGTPVGGPETVSQSRRPPSPFKLTISASEVQTPHSRRETASMTATPSPALLNTIPNEYWREKLEKRPIFCPKLELSHHETQIRCLVDGFTVRLHDDISDSVSDVRISLTKDSSCLHVTEAITPSPETEHMNNDQNDTDARCLHTIAVNTMVRVECGKETTSCNRRVFEDVHPLKCFSIVSKTKGEKDSYFDFECDSPQQRDKIVSSLKVIAKKKTRTLRMRPASLEASGEPIGVSMDLDVSPEAPILSPLHRTRIYAGKEPTEAVGQELSLNYSDDEDFLKDFDPPKAGLPQRKSPNNPFRFADIARQQSMDEENRSVEPNGSMLEVSFDTLDEWCTDDTCTIDLTEVSDNLKGIFRILELRKREGNIDQGTIDTGAKKTHHVRGDSTDLQLQSSCMADFLTTPASIWADTSPSTEKTTSKRSPRERNNRKALNRASKANAQAHRWQQLRYEMTFEAVTQRAQSKMTSIATTKSMDEVERPSRGVTDTVGPFGIFDLLPTGLQADNHQAVIDDSTCLYYDSDPESARLITPRRGPRRALANRLNRFEGEEMKTPSCLNFTIHKVTTRGRGFDKAQTTAIIDIMKSEQIPLIWHPAPTQKHPNRTPQCVTAWIERGTYLMSQSFVQPKWMWKQAQEKNLDARQLSIATEPPERVELLDIARVQDFPKIDRRRFPFVNKRRCFTIETRDEVLVFEAQSVEDKKKIVFGLKLTVSRLASLIMTRNTRAVEEFFEPDHAQVPGEAPRWAK